MLGQELGAHTQGARACGGGRITEERKAWQGGRVAGGAEGDLSCMRGEEAKQGMVRHGPVW